MEDTDYRSLLVPSNANPSYKEKFKSFLTNKTPNVSGNNNSRTSSDYVLDAAEICTKYIESNEQSDLINFLIGLKENITITDIANKEGSTLLHLACFHNNQQAVEVLLNKVRVDCRAEEAAHWVNAKTYKDKFTALHFAAKNGSISIIQSLR